MSQELQNNQVSLTTTDIVFGETSKFKYLKSAKEFFVTCQDYASVLGHSSVNCPETICLNCLEHGLTVKGHNAGICLKPTRYWPVKSQTGINLGQQGDEHYNYDSFFRPQSKSCRCIICQLLKMLNLSIKLIFKFIGNHLGICSSLATRPCKG